MELSADVEGLAQPFVVVVLREALPRVVVVVNGAPVVREARWRFRTRVEDGGASVAAVHGDDAVLR